ncbi:MAG: XRE family transcriptional regulator [Erysipelotrichaceae bacterium]|nr:XRE family transcriptional regulator [Erysipelotrichaceae bacterium]
MDLGKRVKELRIKNNLTLDELAGRCELTKGFLSQLENNVTSITFSSLEDVIEALGSNLEDFFKKEKNEQIVFNKNDYFVNEKEDSSVVWIVPNALKNQMEPIILTLSTKASSNEIKPHDGEEMGYCLKGKVTLVDLSNNRRWVIKKGETFYIKGDFLHMLINESQSEAKILWISNPPTF